MKSFVPSGARIIFATKRVKIPTSLRSAFPIKVVKFHGRYKQALEIVGGKGNFVPTGDTFIKLPGYRDFRKGPFSPKDVLAITSLDGKMIEENPYLLGIEKFTQSLRSLTYSKSK